MTPNSSYTQYFGNFGKMMDIDVSNNPYFMICGFDEKANRHTYYVCDEQNIHMYMFDANLPGITKLFQMPKSALAVDPSTMKIDTNFLNSNLKNYIITQPTWKNVDDEEPTEEDLAVNGFVSEKQMMEDTVANPEPPKKKRRIDN